MRKRNVIFKILLVLCVFLLIVLLSYLKINKKYRIKKNISSADIEILTNWVYSSGPVTLRTEDEIKSLNKCISSIKEYNANSNHKELQLSIQYKVTFHLENGGEESYVYRVYPSDYSPNPFSTFFSEPASSNEIRNLMNNNIQQIYVRKDERSIVLSNEDSDRLINILSKIEIDSSVPVENEMPETFCLVLITDKNTYITFNIYNNSEVYLSTGNNSSVIYPISVNEDLEALINFLAELITEE